LERAHSDRDHHFLPSSPSIYAWAFGDTEADVGRNTVLRSRWLVPSRFSCQTGRAVGRWVWKVANTCNDADNLGIKTEAFSMDEYRAVVNKFKRGQNVQGKCTSSPEQFVSCFVFAVASGVKPADGSIALTTRMAPTTTTIPETQAADPTTTILTTTATFSPTPSPVASSDSARPSPTHTEQECLNTAFSQCGGVGFRGTACCPNGHYCKRLNDFWWQCWSCEYFPDAACGRSLLGQGRNALASRKHNFLGTALLQAATSFDSADAPSLEL